MKDIFRDILSVEGVHGIAVIDSEGSVILSRFSDNYKQEETGVGGADWSELVRELADIEEAELVYERGRIYIRKIQPGFLITVLDDISPVSMVRLNCEILQPSLDRLKPGGRIGQILKRRIF